MYIVVWLLYNYCTLSRSLSYELVTLCHISIPVVWSFPPIFLKWVHNRPSWALFLPLYSVHRRFDRVQLLFHFSVYILPAICLHQHMVLQFVPTLSTLLHCHCTFHLYVSHNIQTTFVKLKLLLPTMLPSLSLISDVCGLNPFVILFT
jgi:hypothetical protein